MPRRNDQLQRKTKDGISVYKSQDKGDYWAQTNDAEGFETGAAGSTEKNAIKNYHAFVAFLATKPDNPFGFQNPYP